MRLYTILVLCHMNRVVYGSKAGTTTEDNPAYGVSGPVSGVGVATEDNPAYGVSGPVSGVGVATEDNPAYGVSGPVSGVGVATEDNPAYGVSGTHGKRGQIEQMYEMPDFIQPPPASH